MTQAILYFLCSCYLLSLSYSAVLADEPANTINSHRPKIGLALGGGGTRGIAHVGVLKVFEREGIPIDYIAGTSMGSIVGGLYSAGVPLDRIEEMLLNKSLLHSYNTVPVKVRIAVIPFFFMAHVFGYHPLDGLYRGNKFAKFLDRSVPETRRDIEELKIPFAVVASDLISAKAYPIRTGNLGRALQASSAIPVLRRPVPMQGKLLVDGGVEANVPAKEVRDMGADIVIAVDVDDTFEPAATIDSFRRIGSVSHRTLNMFLAKVDEPELKSADIVIHPDVNGINLLSMHKCDALRAIAAGEEAANNALAAIIKQINKPDMVMDKP